MIKVTTDVICDRCGYRLHGIEDIDKRAKMARELAAGLDWIARRENGQLVDICPKCQEEEKDQ